MSIETAVRDLLSVNPAVTALVGDRITPWPAPQNQVAPFVTWQTNPGERVFSFGGPSGLVNPQIEVRCWSDTGARRDTGSAYLEARAVAKAVRQALDGYDGQIDGLSIGFVLTADGEDFESETQMVFVSLSFSVWHEEN